MSFLKNIFGRGEKTKQFPRYTPDQQAALDSIRQQSMKPLPQGMEFLAGLFDQSSEGMRKFQAPALRQFNEEVIPSIAERFTGLFGEGSDRSSAFGQQLGQAAVDLEERLAAQRGMLALQAFPQLFQLLNLGLSPQFENVYFPRQPGFLEGIAAPAAQGFGQIGGTLGALKLFS